MAELPAHMLGCISQEIGSEMCEWRSKTKPEYFCSVPAEPGSHLCVFHQDGAKSLDRFRDALGRQLRGSRSPVARNPPFDFTGYVFPAGVAVEAASEHVHCAVLPHEIHGDLCLVEARINGDLLLSGIAVSGTLDLAHSIVVGKVEMIEGELDAGLKLDSAIIEGVVDIRSSTIQASQPSRGTPGPPVAVSGNKGLFKEGIILLSCRIQGLVVLAWASAGNEVCLDYSTIEGGVYLSSAKLGFTRMNSTCVEGRLDASHALFSQGLSLSGTKARSLEMCGASVRGVFHLPDAQISGSVLMAACTADSLSLGIGYPSIGILKPRKGISISSHESEAEFWLFAQQVLAGEGKRDEADAAHFFRRTAKLKSAIQEAPAIRKLPRILAYLADAIFLRLPTAYGSSLFRLAATWVTTVVGFATLYWALFNNGIEIFSARSPGIEHYAFDFWRALYFSVITFTTLGYGDIHPAAGLGSTLSSLEAVLGGITMALTVVLLGRKFMR